MFISSKSKIFIAGRRGMVGSAIWQALYEAGYRNLIGPPSSELDLRCQADVEAFFTLHKPDAVVLAAAKVGGILANSSYPADFISDNLQIQTNILGAARTQRVARLLFLGSSCIYPKFAPQPIEETALLTGPLEPTNEAYAVAKIAGITQVKAVRRQDGLHWVSAMPTNLYGRGDNFDLQNAHVLPALLRKFDEAKSTNALDVVVWGTGQARREFMHVADLAAASVRVLEDYDEDDPINIGTGTDVTIRELAELIASTVGYEGRLTFDTSKPDGTPQKLLDVSKLGALGFTPDISLRQGLADVYSWYKSESVGGDVRGRPNGSQSADITLAGSSLSLEEGLRALLNYASLHPEVLRYFDLVGEEKVGQQHCVNLSALARLAFLGRALSPQQAASALAASDSAPWETVPADAWLGDADPGEQLGLFAAAEALYRHFLDAEPRIGAGNVSALMHLARPALYPLLDLPIRRVYDTLAQKAWSDSTREQRPASGRSYWPPIRADLIRADAVLAVLRGRLGEMEDPTVRSMVRLSNLRMWDIIVRSRSADSGFQAFWSEEDRRPV